MSDEADRMQRWIEAARAELELPTDVTIDVAALLDLARISAHGVVRPAAPLTTFLAGYAAGLAGGSDADIARAVDRLAALAAALPDAD
ncbi:DUF6457 domain-containing protein [Conyzicola sp.]|uniref:DUF6457 domain-containing protein n=1 Tax=Conyzicola sp. TaxID=1969404 RepID=UPI003989B020